MSLTNTEHKLIKQISIMLKSVSNVKGSTLENRQKQRIEIIKKIFAIFTTTEGINIINKLPLLSKVVREKLVDFTEHIPELSQKWHLQIFGEKIAEPESDPYEREVYLDFNNWINDMTKSATLTRNRMKFFKHVWRLIQDIDDACCEHDPAVDNFPILQKELYNTLISNNGQNIMNTFKEFNIWIGQVIHEQYIYGAREWINWWSEIFGCDAMQC